MRRLALALLATSLLLPSTPADDASDREYDKAARMILCDCGCHPQSVHDCACGRADVMRQEIAALIASGKTGQQVIDDYVSKHGEKIRVVPVAKGFGLLAWLGPVLALFLGAGVGVLILRRWRHHSVADPAEPGAVLAPDDDPYRRRVEARLEGVPVTLGAVLSLLLIAAAALYVLLPLFRKDAAQIERRASALSEEEELATQQEMAIAALKDLEDDRATGKIADKDYEDVKSRLTKRAVEILKRQDDVAARKARPTIVPDPPR